VFKPPSALPLPGAALYGWVLTASE